MANIEYKRVMLKISGEALSGTNGFGFDFDVVGRIAREVKEKIESNLKYPGTIKITVIRETRAIEEAK